MLSSDFEQIKDLTSLCFKSENYIQNFPQVFQPQNSPYFIFKRENQKIISFCSLYPTYFQVQNNFYTGYCVGSVCTHPQFQKKGIASELLKEAEEKVRYFGGDFIYLFSSQKNIYEKLDYSFFGKSSFCEINLSQLKKISINLAEVSYLKCSSLWDETSSCGEVLLPRGASLSPRRKPEPILSQLWSFIIKQSSPRESLLSFLEFQSLLKIKNMKLCSLTLNNEIQALCFFNKGDDFDQVIHGIYFTQPQHILVLIKYILQTEKEKNKLYFFPGIFSDQFSSVFNYEFIPTMYAKIMNKQNIHLDKALRCEELYVRSLQGT